MRGSWKWSARTAGVAFVAAACFGSVAAGASAAGVSPTGQPGQFTFVDEDLGGGATVSVNPGTGNLLVAAEDLTEDPATYGVTLSRYYNSQSPETGALGPRWNWSVGPDVRIVDAGPSIDVHGPTGSVASLSLQDDGTWSTDAFDGAVTKTSSGYAWQRDEGDRYTFDTSGTLTSYTDDDGAAALTVQSTSAAGRTLLSSYGTAGGRRVNFSYNGTPRVIQADDPASVHRTYGYDASQRLSSYGGPGGTAHYAYDSAGLLSSVSQPDGTTATITYAGSKVSKVQVAGADGATRGGATYTYGSPTDAACDSTTDIAQTTVTPLDGSAATVYCSTPEGVVDNTSDDDVSTEENVSEFDADSPECAPGPDGYDARCSDPYGSESGADGPEVDTSGVDAAAASFGVARASAVPQARVFIDAHPWVTIRSGPKSFAVGNARGGWIFDRTAISRSYDLGTVYGRFSGCGWVSQSAVGTNRKPPGRPHSNCSRGTRVYKLTRFASQINCTVKKAPEHHCTSGSTGFTLPAGTVECFNVGPILDRRGKTKPCGTGTAGRRVIAEEHTHVSWRYVTRDKKYVLIRDSDAKAEDGTPGHDNDGPWVFVKRSVLPANLCGHPNNHYIDPDTGKEAHLCHI